MTAIDRALATHQSTSTQVTISFVLPAHNEAEILVDTVNAVRSIGDALGGEYEVIVVENGSTDTTSEVALRLLWGDPRGLYVRLDEGDYGAAMRHGLLVASGDVAVVFDCDLYDEGFARSALEVLDGESVAMVVASKRHVDSHDNRSLFRRAGTATFSWLIRKMTGMKASDSHGMKVVDLRVADFLVRQCMLTGHVFDTELVIRSERAGFVVAELPCDVDELRPARSSYLSRVLPALKQAVQLRRAIRS